MSRILMLLPSVPEAMDTGAKIRNRGLITLLRADHEVDAIAFGTPDDRHALERLACRSAVVAVPPTRPRARRALDLARSDLPDMALRLRSPAFMQAVRCFLDQRDYDVVQAEGIEMAPYLSAVPAERRVYDAHNAEFLLQRRAASSAGSVLARLYSRLQWRRLERFERAVVRTSAVTLAVSEHDANQLLALAGATANVRVVPNAINVACHPFSQRRADRSNSVLFVGKLDFRPNAEALRWFIDEVLVCLPDARLFAVGAAPPRWLVRAGQHDPRVAVTGYVADERPYLERCAALVLPVQSGGGSRLKALIAMASGLPVVSTRLGMEGLDAEPGEHYLAAESASEWVAALPRLLGDPSLRERLARSARALVEGRYDWSVLRAPLRDAYAGVLN